MTPRRMPPLLVTGCVLALVFGGCLAQAVEREKGQEDRQHSEINEPVQHKVGYLIPAAMQGGPLEKSGHRSGFLTCLAALRELC